MAIAIITSVLLFFFDDFDFAIDSHPQIDSLIIQFTDKTVEDSLWIYEVTDRYYNLLKEEKYDDALRILNKLSEFHTYQSLNQPANALLFSSFLPYVDRINDHQDLGLFWLNYGEHAIYQEDEIVANQYLKQSIAIFESSSDSANTNHAYAYLKAGETANKLGAFVEALTYFEKANRLFEFQGDSTMLLWSMNGLAAVFSSSGLYQEAKELREQIIDIAIKKEQFQVACSAHLSQTIDESKQDNHEEEHRHALRSYQYAQPEYEVQDILMIASLGFLVRSYSHLERVDSADYYMEILENQVSDKSSGFFQGYYNLAKAHHLLLKRQFSQAKIFAQKNLNLARRDYQPEQIVVMERLLYQIEKAQGNESKALQHLLVFTELNDSLITSQNAKQFLYHQTKFESEKKDLTIASQADKLELLDAQSRIRTQLFFISIILIIGVFTVVYLTRSRNFAINATNQKAMFSKQLIESQENERKRIARELHDGIGQQMMLITRKLRDSGKSQMADLASRSLSELRSISRGLHPVNIEKFGLTEALNLLIDEFDAHTDLFFTKELNPLDHVLTKSAHVHAYRIVQELLSNIVKHAQARSIYITSLIGRNQVDLVIEDNGVHSFSIGKDQRTNSLGIKTMLERAEIIGATITWERNDAITITKIQFNK